MINMVPEKMPAEARPAIARPRMKTTEEGAAPQMAEPISNMTTLIMKTLCLLVSKRQLVQRNATEHLLLHVVELVDAAVDKLGTSRRQHVGRAIPADVSQSLEVV